MIRSLCRHTRAGKAWRRWLLPALILLPELLLAQCLSQDAGSQQQQFTFTLPQDTLTEQIPADARIGQIVVRRLNVFDLSNPEDNRWYGRLANRLHRVTLERVVRDLLLVAEGDAWQPQQVLESERLLRQQVYLYDARVRPLRLCDKRVDLLVLVRDVWTLTAGFSFSRSGGDNQSRFFISDSNLLGTGTSLSLGRGKDDERTSEFIAFSDETLRGSRWQLNARYADNDDGFDYQLALGKPFYSLNSQSSTQLYGQQLDQESALYFRDQEVETFRQRSDFGSLALGWSRGLEDRHARRWRLGWHYEKHRFSLAPDTRDPTALPQDRTRAFPWLGYGAVENEYRVVSNINALEVSEDLYLGERWDLRLGLAEKATGSSDSLVYWAGEYQNTLWDSQRHLLFLNLEGEGYWDRQRSDWENLMLSQHWRWFIQPYQRRQYFLEARFDYSRNLTRERQLLLGGGSGLRGYPSRFQSGDRAWRVTLEKRYHYDIHPWRLFYVGSAAFIDVGRAWFPRRDNGADGGTLANVGVGLRITSSRFRSDQVLHIDLAFPLTEDEQIDSVQLVLRGERRF